MYKVDLVLPTDFDWVVDVAAKRMLEEEVGRGDFYHKPQIERLVTLGMEGGTALVIRKDGVPVGFLGAVLTPNTYNPEIETLCELIWYVLPEHRGTRAGYMLLRAYKDMADLFGVEATLSTMPHSNVSKESLKKMGFILSESAFLYRKDK